MKSKIICLVFCLYALVYACNSQADTWYLGGEFVSSSPSSSRKADRDTSISMLAGLQTTKNDLVQLELGANQYNLKSGLDKYDALKGSVAYIRGASFFGGQIKPYLKLGIGLTKTEFNGKSNTAPAATIATGLRWHPSWFKKMAFGIEYEQETTFDDDSLASENRFEDSHLSLAIVYSFKQEKTKHTSNEQNQTSDTLYWPPNSSPTKVNTTVDGDGDGVDDISDKCANTPVGFPVDSDGCADI